MMIPLTVRKIDAFEDGIKDLSGSFQFKLEVTPYKKPYFPSPGIS